jgi:cytochrome c
VQEFYSLGDDMNKKLIFLLLFIAPVICTAEVRGSKQAAEAMVSRALEYLKKNGHEKSFKAFTAPSTDFVDKDIYIVAYDKTGRCLAHGQTEKMVGKDFINIVDISGKNYIKERMKLAEQRKEFWHGYKFTDPITKKILSKETFCKTYQELIICSGIYHDE